MSSRQSDAGSDRSQPPPTLSTHEEFEHLADDLLEKHGHDVVKLSELPDCEFCTSGELCCGCRRVRPVHNSCGVQPPDDHHTPSADLTAVLEQCKDHEFFSADVIENIRVTCLNLVDKGQDPELAHPELVNLMS